MPARILGLLKRPLPRPKEWARALRVSEQDAEDLIQDAVLALLEKPDVQPRSARGWIFGAARLGRRRLLRARARAAKYEPQIEAYLRELGGPFLAPDEEIDGRERLLAVFWLLDQVKPGRRAVAERHLFGASPEEDIAAELGLALGTVKSQWRRAKEDMRAALDREVARSGDRAWLVGLLALVASLWLWITGRVRRRSGPLLACAALALVVARHDDDRAEALASVARHDDRAEALAGEETAAELASPFEVRFAPMLTAFAERERERDAATSQADPRDPEAARILLARASAALQRGNRVIARSALAQYRAAYPVDPTPSLARRHAAVAAALASSH